MSLLDNPLVLKYFGGNEHPKGCVCHKGGIYPNPDCEATIPESEIVFRILAAMQEPIKKGERVLYVIDDRVFEKEGGDWCGRNTFHGHVLRLPDRFQPSQTKECDICHRCGQPLDRSGTTDYKWDKSGGVHSCVHIFKPTPPPEPIHGALDQPARAVEKCQYCQVGSPHAYCLPAKDDVEHKIAELCSRHFAIYLEPELRELVRLAREK